MKRILLVLLMVALVGSILTLPVQAGSKPPETPRSESTPVPTQAPARSAPPWLGFVLVFLLPFAYMIFTSLGKKEPGLQVPGQDLPVIRDGDRPFRPYDDEDEDEKPGRKSA